MSRCTTHISNAGVHNIPMSLCLCGAVTVSCQLPNLGCKLRSKLQLLWNSTRIDFWNHCNHHSWLLWLQTNQFVRPSEDKMAKRPIRNWSISVISKRVIDHIGSIFIAHHQMTFFSARFLVLFPIKNKKLCLHPSHGDRNCCHNCPDHNNNRH